MAFHQCEMLSLIFSDKIQKKKKKIKMSSAAAVISILRVNIKFLGSSGYARKVELVMDET